ncbi:MAG: TetR/AcrR family transcriptional regulator [Pseudomonadales bacterium]|nr:TetR/AcrR family transcriptional regulator [Pseudomonadales bacterium]
MKSECRFIRARQPEQKEQRRSQILESAAYLLERDGFDSVSLNGIARQTGVAKSNIYRYFESREDIFLQLLKEDWMNWLDNIEQSLAPLENSDDIDAVVDTISNAVAASPRMCQLISVLASVLEKNLSEEMLFKFKLESVQLGQRLILVVQKALPGLRSENLFPAIHSIIALIAGLWPLGNRNELMEKVMNRPELKAFKIEFTTSLNSAMKLIIKGAYH